MEEMREIIEALVKEKKYFEIRKQLNELNGVEISEIINDFEIPEVVIMIFRLLKKDKAAVVFPYLDSEHQEMIIYASTDIETKNIFDELYFDDIVDIIEEMPADVVKKILKNTDAKDRHLINQLLKYPEYSAGSIMTTEYVDLEKGMKVAEAIDRISGISGSLKDYQVKAVSQGKDALAKVTVKVEFKDEGAIIGRGLDVDTMLASAKAYVAALNTYLDAKH